MSLRQTNASACPSGARHSIPRSRRIAWKVSGLNQSRSCWEREGGEHVGHLRRPLRSGQRDVQVGRTEIAVPLRDLVLQDRRPPEHLGQQLGDQPVILVRIIAARPEHEVGVDSLEGHERVLGRRAEVREVAVPEAPDDHAVGDPGKEDLGAGSRLGGARRDRVRRAPPR